MAGNLRCDCDATPKLKGACAGNAGMSRKADASCLAMLARRNDPFLKISRGRVGDPKAVPKWFARVKGTSGYSAAGVAVSETSRRNSSTFSAIAHFNFSMPSPVTAEIGKS